MKLIAAALIVLYSNSSIAETKYLKQGDSAPFAGYLFDVEAEAKLRQQDKDFEYQNNRNNLLEKINKNQSETIDLMSSRIDLYSKHNENLAKELIQIRQNDFWNNFLYFGLGAIVTGGLAYGAFKVYSVGR